LAAVLGGTQSLHTNSLDEALALPSESSAKLALRTQQVIASESGVTQVVDPLGGSWFVESLTQELEERTWKYLEEMDRRGGTIACIESGYVQNEILNSAYADQKAVDEGSLKLVGVNCNQETDGTQVRPEILRIPPELEKSAAERVKAFRSKRAAGAAADSLKTLEAGARGDANLQELILMAVRSGSTLGEISDTLRKVFGVHAEYAGF
jgi:methylmalonyl-CoA mutase N-terminal domain/subunit